MQGEHRLGWVQLSNLLYTFQQFIIIYGRADDVYTPKKDNEEVVMVRASGDIAMTTITHLSIAIAFAIAIIASWEGKLKLYRDIGDNHD